MTLLIKLLFIWLLDDSPIKILDTMLLHILFLFDYIIHIVPEVIMLFETILLFEE